jgi:ParB family chromosome partitioning protein
MTGNGMPPSARFVYGATNGQPSPTRATGAAPAAGIRQIHVSRLVPNPANIRKDIGDVSELAASIRVHGLLQPLIAEPRADGKYVVIAGHRRLAAAKRAGLDMVPVDVQAGPAGAAKTTVLMLVENCQREDLSAIEKAEALGQLQDKHGWSMSAIARATGLAPSTVSRYMALLDLDGESRDRVKAGTVGVGQALNAVWDARAAQRTSPPQRAASRGVKPRPASQPVRVEAAWFTRDHPLAAAAQARCDHGGRPLEGGVACGQCFEEEIRADERARVCDEMQTGSLS